MALQPEVQPGIAQMCAVHATMRAVITCSRCGNFACAGCRAVPGSTLCKACQSRGGADAERTRKSIRIYNLLSFLFGVPGLLITFGSAMAASGAKSAQEAQMFDALRFVGTIVFIVGLGFYARMKGRRFLHGLWGLFSILGYLGLAYMDKHCHACGRPDRNAATRCESCGAPM